MWLYVPTTSLPCVPALVGSSWESESPSPERAASLTSKGKPMQPRTLLRAWKTGTYIRRLSGLTLAPSILNHGAASFIASLRETLASQTAWPDEDLEPMTIDGLSTRLSASSIACGLIVSSGKTSRGMRTANSQPSSRHWKGWATALRQEYSVRRKSVQVTAESGFSSWPTARAEDSESSGMRHSRGVADTLTAVTQLWPTPMAGTPAQNGNNAAGNSDFSRKAMELASGLWPTPRTITGGAESAERKKDLGRLESGGSDLQAEALTWLTPTTSEGNGIRKPDGKRSVGLNTQAEKWPTPDAGLHGGSNRSASPGAAVRPNLSKASEQWPTPAARDHKGANGADHLENGTGRLHLDQLPNFVSHCLPPDHPTRSGPTSSDERRTLNPLFVEWLMGWPLNWTLADPRSTSEYPRPPSTSTALSDGALTGSGQQETGLSLWLLRMRGSLSTLLCELSETRSSGTLF